MHIRLLSSPIVVRPSEPVTTSGSGTIIKLSSFDRGLEKAQASMLLAFEHPIRETVETIKRALSQALVHYYPFAGRLVASAGTSTGGDEAASHIIQCSGDGVVFVAASASCALKEVIFSKNDLSMAGGRTPLPKLLVPYPDDGPSDHLPLLLMQVTEFPCGGFVLGVTWHHVVSDGAGMGQFLQAIAELACGLPSPTVVPVRSDDSLPRVPAHKVTVPVELAKNHIIPFSRLAFLDDITVPSSLVGRIKDEFSTRFNGKACTVFDTISALMWLCYTRATMSSNPDATALLVFAANVRKHVGLKKAYYGNCVTSEIVRAKSHTVARRDIIDLVKLINHSKEKIGDYFKNNNKDSSCLQQSAGESQGRWQEEEEEAAAAVALALQVPYNNVLIISSWRNIGLHEADFGSGRPVRIAHCISEYRDSLPVFVLLPECKGKVGAIRFSATVKEEHAQAFLREVASFT